MTHRIEVEVDDATAAYLRGRCVRRGDLAAAAAAALHELAVRDAARAMADWYARSAELLDALVAESDAALAEAG